MAVWLVAAFFIFLVSAVVRVLPERLAALLYGRQVRLPDGQSAGQTIDRKRASIHLAVAGFFVLIKFLADLVF